MPGNVLVDDIEVEETPLRPSPWWLAGLAAIVVLTLVLLPGQTSTPAPASTVTVPEVILPEERWSRLDLPGTGMLTGVASLEGGGHVAVGDGPQFWWSGDGTVWEWAVDIEASPGRLNDIAPFEAGAIAVGLDNLDGSDTRAAIWVSDTGQFWERAAIPAERPSGLDGVVAADGRLVAWGWIGSSREFAPDSDPLLLTSLDGRRWTTVDVPDDLHIDSVTRLGDTWYASGYSTGRPAVWSAPDLEQWEEVMTAEMHFGWTIVALEDDGALVAKVLELNGSRIRSWRQADDGSWVIQDPEPAESLALVTDGDETVGIGERRLWNLDEGQWTAIELGGEVLAATPGVVVGGERPFGQPALWVKDQTVAMAADVAIAEDDRWEVVFDLGEGAYDGSWSVAGGWLVASGERWWFVDTDGAREIPSPAPLWAIQAVGDEWVALPSMHWTSDGIDWEQREQPWPIENLAQVEAITERDGQVTAIGHDSGFLWVVAVSSDQGRTWELADPPAPATPLWGVVGTQDGFAATAARSRGTDEVVISPDGRNWEPLVEGMTLVPNQDLPAALTDAGTVVLLDTGEEIRPPRTDIASMRRYGEGLAIVAGGRMWLGPDGWDEILLDPPHGITGWVEPIPLDGPLTGVVFDRGRLQIVEWSGSSD